MPVQVSVPALDGEAPVIDGTLDPGEWDGAAVQAFADGSELLLAHKFTPPAKLIVRPAGPEELTFESEALEEWPKTKVEQERERKAKEKAKEKAEQEAREAEGAAEEAVKADADSGAEAGPNADDPEEAKGD